VPEAFDAVVMGGGPAGATAALCLARRGASVCLYEGDAADRCGETLPPEINPLLRDLGIYDEFLSLGAIATPGIFTAWGAAEPYAQDFIRNPHGCGWHVDRSRFDEMLCRLAAEAGAARRAGKVDPSSLCAGLIVDATGRGGSREVDDKLVALVLRGRGGDTDRRAYIEAVPDGWWYSAPLPGGEMIAMFFTDPQIYSQDGIVPEEQLRHAPLARARLCSADVRSSRTVAVSSSCRREIAGPGWMAVGDSAASYDPLSGRGIFQAMRYAQLVGTSEPAEYAAMVRAGYESYVAQRRRYYAMETRWPDRLFWRRRIN
jgi:flavin-dependent dehydrogenase